MTYRFTYLFLIGLILMVFEAKAQLAIIQDEDGYTNVRDSGDIGAKVLFSVSEDEVFIIEEHDKSLNSKWLPMSLSLKQDAVNCYRTKGRGGFLHSSRVLWLDRIDLQLTATVQDQTAQISDKNLTVTATILPEPKKPDGISCYLGTDQGVGRLRDQLTSLQVILDGKTIPIPKNDLQDLFAIQLKTLKAYQKNGLTILYISTHSAAGYYQCVWVIKNGEYLRRQIYFGP